MSRQIQKGSQKINNLPIKSILNNTTEYWETKRTKHWISNNKAWCVVPAQVSCVWQKWAKKQSMGTKLLVNFCWTVSPWKQIWTTRFFCLFLNWSHLCQVFSDKLFSRFFFFFFGLASPTSLAVEYYTVSSLSSHQSADCSRLQRWAVRAPLALENRVM